MATAMQASDILKLYGEFKATYDEEAKGLIWNEHSKKFREFWKNRVCNGSNKELDDSEIDEIVRILDRNGKGNSGNVEAVARAMVSQGMWRRMFREFKKNPKLRNLINSILFEMDETKLALLIDELYLANEGQGIV